MTLDAVKPMIRAFELSGAAIAVDDNTHPFTRGVAISLMTSIINLLRDLEPVLKLLAMEQEDKNRIESKDLN